MPDPDLPLRIVQACAKSAPGPLFPARFAAENGIDRQRLDAAIDRLRVNGHIEIADWVQGLGQGYTLTDAGADALKDPRLLQSPAPPRQPEPEAQRPPSPWERGERIREAFLNPRPPRVTQVLLFAVLSMYLIGFALAISRGVSPGEFLAGGRGVGNVLHTLGAVSTHAVVGDREWWRLLGYQFLHVDWSHLAMNSLCLYMLGSTLESIWGWRRYLILYLASGVVGGAAIVLTGRPNEVVAGASGPLSGLMSGLAMWLWLNRDSLPESIWNPLMSRAGMNLILLVLISFMPRVAWNAHLGGAVGGALLTIALHYTLAEATWQRLLGWLAVVLIPLIATGIAYEIQRKRIQPHFQLGELRSLPQHVAHGAPRSGRNLPPPREPAPWPLRPMRERVGQLPTAPPAREVAIELDSRLSAPIEKSCAAPIV